MKAVIRLKAYQVRDFDFLIEDFWRDFFCLFLFFHFHLTLSRVSKREYSVSWLIPKRETFNTNMLAIYRGKYSLVPRQRQWSYRSRVYIYKRTISS